MKARRPLIGDVVQYVEGGVVHAGIVLNVNSSGSVNLIVFGNNPYPESVNTISFPRGKDEATLNFKFRIRRGRKDKQWRWLE